jgi:hypothetical protein
MLHFKGGGTAAPGIFCAVIAVIALLVLVPINAPAASVAGSSNTYVQSREQADGTKLIPLYEYLNFNVQNMAGESVTAHFGGWYRYDINEQTTNKDVQYGYLSFKSKSANSMVNLGRIMVAEGVAAERVDGAYARTDLMYNFGLSAFGGVPVETEAEDLPGNNVIYGARLSHQVPGLYRIGFSALKEEKNKEDFRKEEGADIWFRPLNKVELLGKSNYNMITKEWMEHTYVLVLGPFANLKLNTTASSINYKSFFTGATGAMFFFQPGVIDPNEKVKILGEEVSYGVTGNLNVSVDYNAYDYEIAGNAKKIGGNIRYSVAKSGGAGLSVHKMDGGTDLLKYMEYRVYGYKKIGKADITLDALDVRYDVERNNVKDAYSLTLAAAYELMEKLMVGADVEYAKNPDFDKDVRGFLKIVYSFDMGSGYNKAAAEQGEHHADREPAGTSVGKEQDRPKPAVEPAAPSTAAGQGSPPQVMQPAGTTVGAELGSLPPAVEQVNGPGVIRENSRKEVAR